MRSRWHGSHGDDHGAPVEMRFIDMFMTALGALVFLALLLVFLLPKVDSTESDLKNQNEQLESKVDELLAAVSQLAQRARDLSAENTRLNDQIEELRKQASQSRSEGTEDKNVIKRWFGVFLLANGCSAGKPELYVRSEGKLVDFNTGEPTKDAVRFDVSNPGAKTILVGDAYFDIGDGQEVTAPVQKQQKEVESTGSSLLSKNGLHTKLFSGVSRGAGSYSIYLGFQDPRAQGNKECVVQPIYLSNIGLIPAEKIVMTQRRPFAWLRRLQISSDGKTTLGTRPPRLDEDFKRDLANFSAEQSRILCEKKRLCDTIDAHYALLASPQTAAADEFTRGDIFKDCDICPSMVVVEPGSFEMGSPGNEPERDANEGPQHKVTFAKAFAVGQFAVTFAEWDACVKDRGCGGYQAADEGWGRGLRPVINVSWSDAKLYVKWLSEKTGRSYRLLSEAEREYVTRAGRTTPFWLGKTISTDQANYDGETATSYISGTKGVYRRQTLPVKTFDPNPWNLYQVHGNVWEWTEDCYKDDYDDAPSDGSTSSSGDCSQRVLRGGSWRNNPRYLRAAARLSANADTRELKSNFSFRVARDLVSRGAN